MFQIYKYRYMKLKSFGYPYFDKNTNSQGLYPNCDYVTRQLKYGFLNYGVMNAPWSVDHFQTPLFGGFTVAPNQTVMTGNGQLTNVHS